MPETRRPSLTSLVSGATETLARFHLSLTAAFIATGIAILLVHFGDIEARPLPFRLLALFGLGAVLLTSVHLFAEARGLGPRRYLAVAAAGMAVLAALIFTLPDAAFRALPVPLIAVGPALGLSLLVAPFVTAFRAAQVGNDAVWQFNYAAGLGAAFAALAAAILFFGLRAAYATVDRLFGIDLHSELYVDTWLVCAGAVGPWLALARVPIAFDAAALEQSHRWFRVLVGHVLVPLVVAYMAILYVYIAKILIDWELPKGTVGLLVATYATIGVAAHLVAHPWRDSGALPMRLFHRHFYHALYAPFGLLAIALWQRIADYGVTEKRYALTLFAAWLLAMALYHTVARRRLLVVPPASLALLLLLAAFGPWGAASVSTESQMARLAELLAANGRFDAGRVVASEKAAPIDDVKGISSIVAYLQDTGRLDRLRPWFGESAAPLSDKQEVVAALGLEYLESWEDRASFSYDAAHAELLDVAGFDGVGRIRSYHNERQKLSVSDGRSYTMAFERQTSVLTVTDEHGQTVRFDLGRVAAGLGAGMSNAALAAAMTVDAAAGTFRARIYLDSIGGRTVDGAVAVHSIEGILAIGRADPRRD